MARLRDAPRLPPQTKSGSSLIQSPPSRVHLAGGRASERCATRSSVGLHTSWLRPADGSRAGSEELQPLTFSSRFKALKSSNLLPRSRSSQIGPRSLPSLARSNQRSGATLGLHLGLRLACVPLAGNLLCFALLRDPRSVSCLQLAVAFPLGEFLAQQIRMRAFRRRPSLAASRLNGGGQLVPPTRALSQPLGAA
mgnify:CR=1 FL=1